MEFKNSIPPAESQYELLRLLQPITATRTPSSDHLNPFDIYPNTSRSISPARSDLGAEAQQDAGVAQLLPHTSSTRPSPPKSHARKLYLPLALKRISFIAFLAAFIVLAGVLALLFGLSIGKHGITDVESNLYYIWTYGPTAVFTIVSVFWNQVEWRMMQWLPWSLMRKGTRLANESILLDYHSTWNVWAMILAIKRKHFRISLAVIGSLLISALTVVSTGLFAGEFRSFAYNAKFEMITRVNPPGNLNLTAIDSIPYTRAFLTMYQNVTPPLGTNRNSVYEMFFDKTTSSNITTSFTQNSTFTANVTALTFTLDCENATVINNPRKNLSEFTDPLAMESPSCKNTSTNYLFIYASQGGAYKLSATMGCCNCGPDDGLRAQANSFGLQVDNGQDWRLFMFASRFKETPTSRQLLTTNNSDIIGFICQPRITGNKALASVAQDPGTGDIKSNLTLNENWDLQGFNKSSATQLLLGAYKSYYLFTGGPASSSFFLNPGDDGNLVKFFDAQYLRTRAESSIPQIMAQVANEFFMSPVQQDLDGHVLTARYRLIIRNLSFGLMLGGLSLLVTTSAVFLLINQKACVSHDPSSIAGTAAILSQSHELKTQLHQTGRLSAGALEEDLSTSSYRSQINERQNFSIVTNGSSGVTDSTKRPFQWWRPICASLWFRAITLSAPIVLIVLLETGLQISARNGGIATVTVQGLRHYFWLYWPPFAIFLTRIFLNMLDFDSKVLQPYYMLSLGRMNASRSLLESLSGKIAIVALAISIRKRYWAVVASTMIVMLSPFLSIIVASLWQIIPLATTYSVSLRQLDRWNFTDATGSLYYSPIWYSGIDSRDTGLGITTYIGQEGVIPNMILNYNLSYPIWTTSEFVLPTMGVERSGPQQLPKGESNVTVSAVVPALRGNLNCQVHNPAKVSWWSRPQTNTGFSDGILTNVTYDISGLGNSNDNCGYPNNFTISSGLFFIKSNPTYYGESIDTRISKLNLTTRSDCPTRLFFVSTLGVNPTTQALTCRPRIEEVQTSVTLNYPDLTFSASQPPFIVPKSQPRVILDGFFNTSHALPLSDAGVLPILNDGSGIQANNSAGLGDIFPSVNEVDSALLSYTGDTFFQIDHSFGTSLQDMFNNPDLMRTQIERFYTLVVGQLLRSYGREANVRPSGNDLGQAVIQATLSTPNERERLMQNPIVTRVLEGMLFAILLCSIAAMVLQHTRHVVPKEPGSMGAVMSLLAGASDDFWRIFEKVDGCEWMSDREMEKSGMFDEVMFKMGWDEGNEPNVDVVTAESKRGLFRRDHRKVDIDDSDAVGGVSRRWCIDIDGRHE